MHICTIIAKNYLAHARVLARSFLEHTPGGRVSVLIIDAFEGCVEPEHESFEVLTPHEIGCVDFDEMACRYHVLELSTAVKPWLLSHLLRSGSPAITYLDPDIQVFGPLHELDRRARESGLVLTPHNTVPIPFDGEHPSQVDIMIAGVYNLGYISVGADSEMFDLLEWWCERLRRDCRVDPIYGYFVDQRWFDLAPGFASRLDIVRDPEYNVAYWNAHSRSLTRDGDRYAVDGRPLRFFHFSGFDPTRPGVLSRHQTRIDLAKTPVLRQLCAEYADAVLQADHLQVSQWPYTYDRLPDGSHFSPLLRRLYARAYDAGELDHPVSSDEGCDAFMVWLSGPSEEVPGLNRALAEIHATRPDLQRLYADAGGADRQAFLEWAQANAERELAFPPKLLISPLEELPTDTAVSSGDAEPEPWGVNVVGYFRSELGVGEAGRMMVSALDAGNVPLLPLHGRTIPLNRQGHAFAYLDHTLAKYPVNLICMNADALPEFAREAGASFFEGRYSIGLWFWEVATAPPDGWGDAFAVLDEVWVPTHHVADAVASVSSVPTVKITLPLELTPFAPRRRADLGLPEGFMFMFAFDYRSVFERKNPLAVIEAFSRAFEPGAGAALVIKCINADSDPVNHARLERAAASHPDVHVLAGYHAPDEKNALTASCDCYISLHRAEGFGFTMAEAMYLGKPVIATSYSGNLDFMTATNSYLVDHELVPVGPHAPPYPAAGHWAEPDVAHAARLMRHVFEDRDAATARGARASSEIRHTHSAVRAAEGIVQRLELIRPVAVERQHAHPRARAVAAPLRPRLERGPAPTARSPLGPPGRVLRRMALRLMKPFTAYQKTVNEEVLRSLDALELSSTRLEQELLRNDAERLSRQRQDDLTLAETKAVLAALKERGDELSRVQDVLRAVGPALTQRLDEVAERLDDLTRRLEMVESHARAIPYMEGAPFQLSRHAVAGVVQGFRAGANGTDSDAYRSFEDIFRGSEAFIRNRQRRYLDIIDERQPVLDFGCGRGEFLDLLRERGLEYKGVDMDPGMVARSHEKGHTQVVLDDGIEFLARLEDASLGAIFSAQVIEHLDYDAIVRLFELARAKLKPDGLFIAETVNPHSPPALKAFWVDLTHRQPVFPEVALALAKSAGFGSAYVFHPNGTGDVDRDRFVEGEFAVVATPGEDFAARATRSSSAKTSAESV